METGKKDLVKILKKWLPIILVIVVVGVFFGRKSSTTVQVRKIEVKNRVVKRSVSVTLRLVLRLKVVCLVGSSRVVSRKAALKKIGSLQLKHSGQTGQKGTT